MTPIRATDRYPFLKPIVGEFTVVVFISVNALTLFLDAFPEIHTRYGQILAQIDYVCIVYFLIEAMIKIGALGFSDYWQSHWNKFDQFVVFASLPVLLNPLVEIDTNAFAIITLLRLGRFLRFIRVMRFVPNSDHIWRGIARALKASVGVFLILLVLNLVLAVGATMLFGKLPPPTNEYATQYFGNPFKSLYTLFKVFTVEGWYEIPDILAENGASAGWVLVLRIYFVISVLVGGILGLSLANAVFVDEMTTDNNDELEEMVRELRAELQTFRAEFQQTLTEPQIGSTNGKSHHDKNIPSVP